MGDKSRDAFEAAHSHLSNASLRRNGGSTGCYTSATTAMSWAMWQASRKQALEDAATFLIGLRNEPDMQFLANKIKELK